MVNAKDIVDEADEEIGKWQKYLRPAAEWFHQNEGELFEREEAIEELRLEFNTEKPVTKDILSALVSDTVDPVVQVPHNGKRYSGIIEFHEFDGAYGYIEFDDSLGKAKRVVCQQCVNEEKVDVDVVHATAGDPSGSFSENADWDELLNGIHQHYENAHEEVPENVETGASLASPTTIGGNTAYHTGNDGVFYRSTGNDSLIVEQRTSNPNNPEVGQMWVIE